MLKINCQDPRIYLIWGSLLIITSFLEVGRWGVTWLETSRPTSCGSGLGSALAFLGQLRGRNIWLWGNSVGAVTKHCWSFRWQGIYRGLSSVSRTVAGNIFILTFSPFSTRLRRSERWTVEERGTTSHQSSPAFLQSGYQETQEIIPR